MNIFEFMQNNPVLTTVIFALAVYGVVGIVEALMGTKGGKRP
jgi:hypothetical protein